jgi:hypothetical protein
MAQRQTDLLGQRRRRQAAMAVSHEQRAITLTLALRQTVLPSARPKPLRLGSGVVRRALRPGLRPHAVNKRRITPKHLAAQPVAVDQDRFEALLEQAAVEQTPITPWRRLKAWMVTPLICRMSCDRLAWRVCITR